MRQTSDVELTSCQSCCNFYRSGSCINSQQGHTTRATFLLVKVGNLVLHPWRVPVNPYFHTSILETKTRLEEAVLENLVEVRSSEYFRRSVSQLEEMLKDTTSQARAVCCKVSDGSLSLEFTHPLIPFPCRTRQ